MPSIRQLSTVLLLLLHSSFVATVQPIVDLGYSRYQGTSLPNGVSQWLGIRFAAPPLGARRFRRPVDPLNNPALQIADNHGPVCLSTGQPNPPSNFSEDCLFLDVYAPTKATRDSRLPVYVFISGGGFTQLSNANYNGSGLVTAGDLEMIVVIFNYRVGAYGFLAGREVVADGDLNVGLWDQRMAFEWIQRHITNFGGNPGHVVLGGASAGGVSITLHLTAFSGAPTQLFHGALAESQGAPSLLTSSQSQFLYDHMVNGTGCANVSDTINCLRSVPVSVMQQANINIPNLGRPEAPLFSWSPAIDGALVPDLTYDLFNRGKFVRVPMILGDDNNEGTIFTPTNLNTTSDMNNFMANQFPFLTTSQLDTIDINYPQGPALANHGAFFSASALAYGEMRYNCPGISYSGDVTKFQGLNNNWLYHYNVTDPTEAAEGLGVPHTVELNAAWGPANTRGAAPSSYFPGGINANIVPVIQGYWTSFIRTLNPNTLRTPGTPEWENFGTQRRRMFFVTNATAMETVPTDQGDRCAFYATIALSNQQ